MGKKKGKSKGQNESNLEGEGEVVSGLLEEQVREGEVAAAPTQSAEGGGGGKKGKKGRKKKALEEEWDDDLAEIAAESGLSMDTGGEKAGAPLATNGPTGGEGGVPPDRGTGGGGKKKKKKKENDDWEDEVAEELEKMQLNDTEQQDKQQQQQQQEAAEQQGEQQGEGSGGDKAVVKQSAKAGASGGGKGGKQSAEAGASGGGKGGKKKRKKKEQVDWEDDVEMLAREIEGTGGGVGGMVSGQTEKSSSQASGSPILEPHEDHATGGGEEAGGEKGAVKVEEEKGEEEGRTVKTKAEKKAAKKERDKKKKEGGKQKGKASSSTDVPEPQTPKEEGKSETVSIEGEKTEQVTEAEVSVLKLNEEPPGAEGGEVDGAEGGEVDGAEEEGEGDDKKKKKKKKKKAAPEEEKKGKSKKPAKSAILKMKEQIELMRAEQKRREEEELARQKAEEEAQQKEEELARLEQEKKEKKKQKEKERRERRRAVGKPVTKAEKERYAKAQMMLQAMKDQGLQIPALSTEREGGATGGKGKVRYGSRQRTKKMQAEEKVEGTEEGEERMGEGEGEGDEVKASWEDIEDGEDIEDSKNVKEQWDDEFEDGEQDDPAAKPVKPDSPVQPGRGPSSTQAQAGEVAADRGRGEEEGESSEESSESESEEEEELTPYEKAKKRIDIRRKRHAEEMSVDLLRSPVVCVLGHVDTGKTKILDKIRHTNVQDGEAGGITQQIGATFVPEDAVRTQTKMIKEFAKSELKLPGLLIIDTPGHESFSNLRSRGSSMCDLAVLVVDVMHGLEPQTLESMALLRKGKTPFIVALNKIDRLFDWRRMPTSSVRDAVKKQKLNTKDEFDERVRGVVTEFAEQGINVALFWDKVDFKEYIPLVPTSAHTGDGMGDLIALLVTYSQKVLAPKLMLSQEPEAVVLELKVIAGLGTTIDVILRNGILKEGDTLVLTGADGPFTTQVRALLMPQPMRELRVKNAYVNHKAIIASQGVKITAKDLEKTLAGTPVFVAKKSDEIDVLKDEASSIVSNMLSTIQLQERGVYVQASTLGSLEALLEFLKKSKIPYCGVNIGPVHKRDVMKASVMLEHDSQWAVILAFDVRVEREAQEMAENLGVRVFTADIIYHLFDNFLKHRKELRDQKRKEYEAIAIFPCKLRILPDCVFNTRDPIVVGVIVEAGLVKRGTILTVPSKSFVDVGVVSSLEVNHKQVDIARKGEEVCIKIASTGGDAPKLYGRHFDLTDLLISKVSRESIDAVKNYFREDLQKSDWQLFLELKKLFHII